MTENLPKLATREDYLHLHKSLGVMSLGFFLSRIYMLTVAGSMGLTRSTWAMYLVVHMLLSGSSMIFRIPMKRNRTNPMIWPEFRLHSIVFAYRSLLAMLLIALDLPYGHIWRSGLILLTMMAADMITAYYRPQGSTMRAMPMPETWSPVMVDRLNMYYSVLQVMATLGILWSRNMDVAYLILFPIQLAALLMTLVRKGIIGAAGWHVAYAIALGLNYVHGAWLIYQSPITLIGSFLAIALCVLRFRYRINKYLLWSGLCLAIFPLSSV